MIQYAPCFFQLLVETFPISTMNNCCIYRKLTFSYLFYLIFFSQKILFSIAILFQHPWNPKQNKVDIFTKPSFQEVTQCHHTQIHYKLWFDIKSLVLNISYYLLNLGLRLLEISSNSFNGFQDRILIKLLLQ